MNYQELLTKLEDYPPDVIFRVYCPVNKRYYNVIGLSYDLTFDDPTPFKSIIIKKDDPTPFKSIIIKKDDPTSFKNLMYQNTLTYRNFSTLLRTDLMFAPILKVSPIRFVGGSTEFKVL
jgi:hypothetical protein